MYHQAAESRSFAPRMGVVIVALTIVVVLVLVCLLSIGFFNKSRVNNKSRDMIYRPSHSLILAPRRTVVLVTGELRFEDQIALDAFRSRLRTCLVLVCTWKKFERIGLQLVASKEDLLLVDTPPKSIPHTGSYQFDLLQIGVRHFTPRLEGAPVVARLRTDALYGDDFHIPLLPPGVVAMESDHAMVAEPVTFIRTYGNVVDEMLSRRVYKHREEGRSLLPNWINFARSDISNVDLGGWRTRWRWLDFPTSIFPLPIPSPKTTSSPA